MGFGSIAGPGQSRPASQQVRINICNTCMRIAGKVPSTEGFIELGTILQHMPASSPPLSINDALNICETEGAHNNGGGNFTINPRQPLDKTLIRYQPDQPLDRLGADNLGGPSVLDRPMGEIGSPILGNSEPRCTCELSLARKAA
jgi:hypothetical protein